MATKTTKTTKKRSVWVFENRWDDRHGDQGSNVKVFSTKAKADEYFAKDIKTYLENYELLAIDGTVSIDNVSSLSTDNIELGPDDIPIADIQKDAIKSGWLNIDVDNSGTNAYWSVSEMEVE